MKVYLNNNNFVLQSFMLLMWNYLWIQASQGIRQWTTNLYKPNYDHLKLLVEMFGHSRCTTQSELIKVYKNFKLIKFTPNSKRWNSLIGSFWWLGGRNWLQINLRDNILPAWKLLHKCSYKRYFYFTFCLDLYCIICVKQWDTNL